MLDGKSVSIQSIDRAAAILNCFAREEALSLSEIARRTGLKKTTAFGIVSTLFRNGLMDQDTETERYFLGPQLLVLAGKVRHGVHQVSYAHLSEMAARTKQTVFLCVRSGMEAVCTAFCAQDRAEALRLYHFGHRSPLHSSAAGKALLAYMPQQRLNRILDGIVFQQFTPKTTATREQLLQQLDEIRAIGYALSFEELTEGVVSVAVPILNAYEEAIGAIGVATNKEGAPLEQLMLYRDELVLHARMIERELRSDACAQ